MPNPSFQMDITEARGGEVAGRRDEAREWFAKTALVDVDDATDAAERA